MKNECADSDDRLKELLDLAHKIESITNPLKGAKNCD